MTDILVAALALFWVIQLIVTIVLLRKLSVRINKKDSDEKCRIREEKLFKLYQNLEEMMDTFEEFVNTSRQELNLDRRELTELSRQASAMFYQYRERVQTAVPEQVEANVKPPDLTQAESVKLPVFNPYGAAAVSSKTESGTSWEEDKVPNNENIIITENEKTDKLTQKDRDAVRKFSTKAQKVRYLMQLGLSVDEVAKELDIGIGEVKLISDLDK